MAHLARANPFNAPHLQLVHDGLAGPSSSPAGPPGAPRRPRKLAAAAVEGEVGPGAAGSRPGLEDRERGRAAPARPG